MAAIRANFDNKPDILVDTFTNNSTTAQFFMNDTSGGYFGGCPLPDTAFGINLCSPTTYPSTMARFSASTAAQPTVRKMEIWIDGVKRYEQLTTHDFSHYGFMDTRLKVAAGTHQATIYSAGYDNQLERKDFTIKVQ